MSKPEFEFLGLRRNALVVTITSFFLGIGRILGLTFLDLYARHLGAPILVLGLFGSIQGLIRLSLVAPLGYLSDIIGHRRKWILAAGDAFSALAYFIYASARDWVWLIPGIIFESGFQVTSPIGTAIVSDSINPDKRGMAMATRSLTIMLPNTFAPILGGILLDAVGMGEGMPFLFIIAGLVRVSGTLGRAIFIKEEKGKVRTREVKASETTVERVKGVASDMLGPLASTKALQTMAAITFIGAIGLSVTSRFQAVYVTEVIGLTKTEWGLVVGMAQAIGAILRIPLGRVTDIVGRRKCILIDYGVRPIYFLGFAHARSFLQVFILNTLHDLSGEAGAPAWQAMMIDVTPRGTRGRVQGAFAMVSAVTGSIFPSLGAFLWEAYGPIWVYYVCSFGEAAAVLAIYLFLKEPEQREA